MKHVFPPTHTLWQKCASPQGLTFHTHAKEHVVVINISLIWPPLNLCVPPWLRKENRQELQACVFKELHKGQWAEMRTILWKVSATQIGKLRQEIPLEETYDYTYADGTNKNKGYV